MSFLGERFWVTCYAALALGWFLPVSSELASTLVPPSLCGILFFTVLGIDSASVATALSGAGLRRTVLLSLLKLLVIPALAWGLFALVLPAWAPAALLVAAVPAGLSSPTLAGLRRPDAVAPALAFVILSSSLSPLTVPTLLALLTEARAEPLPLALSQAQYIGALLLGPWISSRAVRRFAPAWVAQHRARFRPLAVSCLVFLVFVAAAKCRRVVDGQAGGDATISLMGLATMTALAVFLGAASLLVSLRLPPAEAVAFPAGVVFMNNGLGIALASRYFPEDAPVLVGAALIEVPILFGVHVVTGWAERLVQARTRR